MSGFVVLALASVAQATPITVTHTGRALDPSGAPIEGARDVTVRVLEDVSGVPTQRWSDTFTSVPFADGYYAVVLGSDDLLDGALFVGGRAFSIEVTVGSTVLPVQPIGTVPVAASAHRADVVVLPLGVEGASCAPTGQIARDDVGQQLLVCSGGTWSRSIDYDASTEVTRNEIRCEARGGEWNVATQTCTEFATAGCNPCATWDAFVTACTVSGRHPCTYAEYPLALRSIQGQIQHDLLTSGSAYLWVAGYDVVGNKTTTGNQMWYNWGQDTSRMTCSTTSAPMFGLFHTDANSNGANGCHPKSYTSGLGPCCRNFPW